MPKSERSRDKLEHIGRAAKEGGVNRSWLLKLKKYVYMEHCTVVTLFFFSLEEIKLMWAANESIDIPQTFQSTKLSSKSFPSDH